MDDIELPIHWHAFDGSGCCPYPTSMSMNSIYALQKYGLWYRGLYSHRLTDYMFEDVGEMLEDLHRKMRARGERYSLIL